MNEYEFYEGIWYGKSGYTKPTGINQTGVPLIEMDTGKIYFFSAADNDWIEFDGSGT